MERNFSWYLLKIIALTAICIATGRSAEALSITYGPGAPVVPVALQATELVNKTLTFPQWNPALFPGYALTQVEFTLFGHAEGEIQLTNNDPNNSQSASGTTTVNMTLTDPNSNAVAVAIPSFGTGLQSIPAASSSNFTGLLGNNSNNSGSLVPLAIYIGPGTFNMTVNSLTGFSLVGGGGNIASTQVTNASADGSVTYTYDLVETSAVPEPTTFLLGAAGLGVMVLLAMQRKLIQAD